MQAAKGESLNGLRLLVVEDEYFIARDIETVLTAGGAEVIGPVGRLDAAMNAVRSEHIDGAVLDIDLHGEAIYPVAEELARRKIPLLFVTGYEEAEIPKAFRHVTCVEKPFGPKRLGEALAKAFGRRPARPRETGKSSAS